MAGDRRRGLADMERGVAALDDLAAPDHDRLMSLARAGFTANEYNPWATLAVWLAGSGRYEEARTLAERSLALAPAAGEAQGSPADAYLALGYTHAFLGRPGEARVAFTRARDAYRSIGHFAQVSSMAHVELALVVLPYQTDHLLQRQQLAAEAEQAWTYAGDTVPGVPPRLARLALLILDAHWVEARRLGPAAPALFGMRPMFGSLARAQGDTELAWRLVREALPAGPATEPGETSFLTTMPLLRLAAALALDAQDCTAARQWLDAHERWLAWSGALLGRAEGRLLWAMFYHVAGDATRAREHAAAAIELASAPRQPLVLLAAHRFLGRLETEAGDLAGAAAHLQTALQLADACAAPYEQALVLLALARLRVASGNLPEARALLDEVRAICTPLEAAPALAEADALAAVVAQSAARSPANRGYPAGLTPREVEVLRLVAAGLTDAQVAERLHLSPRTVSSHLTAIYGKLGVSSRSAATRFAVDQGLT
jgi:DNA-binding CsgD family transcriptional regulator